MRIRKHYFLLALAVLVIANLLVMGRVVVNRMGVTDTIVLTERELAMPYRQHTENSGILLRLEARHIGTVSDDSGSYYFPSGRFEVGEEQRQKLGFSERECDDNSYRQRDRATIEAWGLYQYQGDAWRQDIDNFQSYLAGLAVGEIADTKTQSKLEREIKMLDRLENELSRLYLIELASERDSLTAKDSGQHLVSKVVLRDGWKCGEVQVKSHSLGRIFVQPKDLGITEIPEHYTVTLSIGKLGIPWVSNLQARTHHEDSDHISKRCRNSNDPVECTIRSMLEK